MRIERQLLILTIAVAVSFTSAGAQQPTLPKPGPEITKLANLFLGTCRTSERHEKSGLIVTGRPGRGTQTFRRGPGSLTLIFDNDSGNPSFAFSGHGVMTWDAREGVYKSFWSTPQSRPVRCK
jgi:hypothetical protein